MNADPEMEAALRTDEFILRHEGWPFARCLAREPLDTVREVDGDPFSIFMSGDGRFAANDPSVGSPLAGPGESE